MILIIDNLDYIYHLHDRGLFAKEASRKTGIETRKQSLLIQVRKRCHGIINYLLESFFNQNPNLCNLGINVLLVMREDSLSSFKRHEGNEIIGFDPFEASYRILSPELVVASSAHIELLQKTAQNLPLKYVRNVFLEAIAKIDPNTENNPKSPKSRLHRDLYSLSRQGLRQAIEHCGQYVWLPIGIEGTDEERYKLTERFQEQYSPGVISFIQKGNRLFTQFESHFPNMYLVRGDCLAEKRNPWENLCLPHKHTYWLKRLMLEFIKLVHH